MHNDPSPCDLSAVRGAEKDNLDDWSISLSESLHPHYRYRVVCSKWGKLWVIGSGCEISTELTIQSPCT